MAHLASEAIRKELGMDPVGRDASAASAIEANL
jgi:hypothetical protein